MDGGYGIGGNEGGGGPVAAGLGLGLPQWMAWLGLAALGCAWFDEQRVSLTKVFRSVVVALSRVTLCIRSFVRTVRALTVLLRPTA